MTNSSSKFINGFRISEFKIFLKRATAFTRLEYFFSRRRVRDSAKNNKKNKEPPLCDHRCETLIG